MVQIDVALSAAVGSTLAVAARKQLGTEPRIWKNGYLGAAVAFLGFFLVPSVLYFLSGWPAWDSMYWWDKETLPAYLTPAVAMAVLATGIIGFVATHSAIRAGKMRAAFALPLVFLLPALVVIGAFYDRVLHVGSKATFAAGAPKNLFSTDLVWAQVTVIPILVGVPLAVLAWRWMRRAAA
jgi:hypothetical protein